MEEAKRNHRQALVEVGFQPGAKEDPARAGAHAQPGESQALEGPSCCSCPGEAELRSSWKQPLKTDKF